MEYAHTCIEGLRKKVQSNNTCYLWGGGIDRFSLSLIESETCFYWICFVWKFCHAQLSFWNSLKNHFKYIIILKTIADIKLLYTQKGFQVI